MPLTSTSSSAIFNPVSVAMALTGIATPCDHKGAKRRHLSRALFLRPHTLYGGPVRASSEGRVPLCPVVATRTRPVTPRLQPESAGFLSTKEAAMPCLFLRSRFLFREGGE
jgi:hypothetical protein